MQTDSSDKKLFAKSVRALIKRHWQQLAIAAFFAGMLLFLLASGLMNGKNYPEVRYIEPITPQLSGSLSDSSDSKTSDRLSDLDSSEKTDYPLDINKVSYSQLCEINGIGRETAGAIIIFRSGHGTVTSLEQLSEISGIGEKTVKLLSRYLFVSDSDRLPYVPDLPKTSAEKPSSDSSDYPRTEKTSRKKSTARPSRETESPQTTVPETEPMQIFTPEPESQSQPPSRRRVNINFASAEEISECLLLTLEKSRDIVEVREQIGYFSDINELFLVESLTEDDILQIAEYVEI